MKNCGVSKAHTYGCQLSTNFYMEDIYENIKIRLGRAVGRAFAAGAAACGSAYAQYRRDFRKRNKGSAAYFQADNGLSADGIAGPASYRALTPYCTGFTEHRIRRGDTLFSLARQYNVPLPAILTANPGVAAGNLSVGESVVIPLPFDIVPTNVSFTSTLVSFCVRGIAARYPFVKAGRLGRSVMGKPLWYLALGDGEKRVFYNAAHHANEWITIPVLLKFAEQLACAYAESGRIFGQSARKLFPLHPFT